MPIEIERKFLVKNDSFLSSVKESKKIKQAYVSKSSTANVRVRLIDDIGYITVKGKSDYNCMSRFEWEHIIPKSEAEVLLEFAKERTVIKTRYFVPEKSGFVFEIDVFEGDNKGLIVAEIELNSEGDLFERPPWLGREVTTEKKYYNSALSRKPYKKW